MSDGGKKNPKGPDDDAASTKSTDGFKPLPSAVSTLSDEGPTGPKAQVSVATLPPGEWPTVVGITADGGGLKKNARGEWETVVDPPATQKSPSKNKLPPVEKPPSKTSLPQVKGPPPRASKQHAPLKAEPPAKAAAESPTMLRPSLNSASNNPTLIRPQSVPDTTERLSPADTSPESGSHPMEPLRDDPAKSTMGYASLKYSDLAGKVLDRRTKLILGMAVGGTFAVILLVWGLTSTRRPAADITDTRALPRSIADGAPKPPPTVDRSRAIDAPTVATATAIFIEDQVDAGGGATRTVKVEAGTVQIIANPEVTISRGGVELGKTPITVTLPVGPNVLQVANKPIGLVRTMTLNVEPGVNTSKLWEFARGQIEVRSTPGTKVIIDGRAVGKTPLAPVALWPGSHLVEVVFPKGDKDQRKVDVEAGYTQATDFEAPVHDSALAP